MLLSKNNINTVYIITNCIKIFFNMYSFILILINFYDNSIR